MLSWTRASGTNAAAAVAGTSFLALSLRRLGRMPAAWIGGTIVVVLLSIALAGKAVTPYDPLRIAPLDKLLSSSPPHLFGTDDLGPDLLSRVIAGARISLLVGALVLAIAMRSEEHTSELQSRLHLVCRLLLEKKKYSVSDMWLDISFS